MVDIRRLFISGSTFGIYLFVAAWLGCINAGWAFSAIVAIALGSAVHSGVAFPIGGLKARIFLGLFTFVVTVWLGKIGDLTWLLLLSGK